MLLIIFITNVFMHFTDALVPFSYERDIPSLKCIPNSIFRYDHNVCHCNTDGTHFFCERKLYTTIFPELKSIQLQNLTIECLPSMSTFEVQCHKCICDDTNKYATCLRLPCASKNLQYNSPESCIPGSIVKHKCNACICGLDGKAACTNLNCLTLHGQSQRNDIMCVPGYNLAIGCNECSCNGDGTSISCDKIGCQYPNIPHEHVLNVTMPCIAKTIFDYNCHKCICNRDGTYAICVGVECPHQYDIVLVDDTVEKCNPGMIFAKDCNVCICDRNGQGVCTTLRCDFDYKFEYTHKPSFL